jgi:flagellin-like hook-associated protein FlgL
MNGLFDPGGLSNLVAALGRSMERQYAGMSSGLKYPSYAYGSASATMADALLLRYSSVMGDMENREQQAASLQTRDTATSVVYDDLQGILQLQQRARAANGDHETVAAIQSQIDDRLDTIRKAVRTETPNGNSAVAVGEKLQAVMDEGVVATGDSQAVLEAMTEVDRQRLQVGSEVQALQASIRAQSTEATNLLGAWSQIAALDYAMAMTEQVGFQIREAACIGALNAVFDFEEEYVAQLTR